MQGGSVLLLRDFGVMSYGWMVPLRMMKRTALPPNQNQKVFNKVPLETR